MTVGKLRFVICVWFLFMFGSCLCRFVVKNNSLKVSSPENLKGIYECAISDFGVPEHGGTLTGVVVYPNVNQEACDSFTHEFSFKAKSHAGSLPVFLLVDGRDCYFTSKALNAQNAGAAGLLVAYDEILTSMYFPEVGPYNITENVTIPLAFISRSLGESIKNALYEGEFVRVNLEWTEAFTDHQDEPADINNNNIDEYQSNCDDQIEEHELEVHDLRSYFMWRFMIKFSPFWGFMMLNINSWLMFLWENGFIESVL